MVKQALPRLRVSELWLAKRERAVSEADALTLAGTITPDAVPVLLDLDRERCALTIAGAPRSWTTWKSRLLAGDVDPGVSARLGETLAAWHRATFGMTRRGVSSPTTRRLISCALIRFYRTVSARRPSWLARSTPLENPDADHTRVPRPW